LARIIHLDLALVGLVASGALVEGLLGVAEQVGLGEKALLLNFNFCVFAFLAHH
jgi:hypothetical protein